MDDFDRDVYRRLRKKDTAPSDGLFARILQWWARLLRPVTDTLARWGGKIWRVFEPIATFLIRTTSWCFPRVAQFAHYVFTKAAYRTDESGVRYFSPYQLLINTIIAGVLLYVLPVFFMGVYYYGTWSAYEQMIIPNAGVFVNQQFTDPSKPGDVIAPRDEIFTVLGHHIDRGHAYPIRLDIDSNMYFFWKPHSWRPDLMASQIIPQSPEGVECSLETTGIYARLPRYLRFQAIRWFDVRLEVVDVQHCHQLTHDEYQKYEMIINSSETTIRDAQKGAE